MIRAAPRLLGAGQAGRSRDWRASGAPVAFGLLLAGLLLAGLLLAGLLVSVFVAGGAPVEHIQLLAPMRWGEVALLA